jgi:uncharacterized iron-regulated protein
MSTKHSMAGSDSVAARGLTWRSRLAAVFLGLAAGLTTAALDTRAERQEARGSCVPTGAWVAPGRGALDSASLLSTLAESRVVLLGERHDRAEDHRWQLQVLAALHARRPDMVIGFEMFPRRVQPALDKWVAGELSEQEFLRESEWSRVWGYDPQLYLPLFHFARMNRIRMVALNVEPGFTRTVTREGFDAVPPEKREGVSRPAAPPPAYVERLFDVYLEHDRAQGAERPTPQDADFRRFVESQTTWDRAMAQGLAEALDRRPGALAVGIAGGGHVVHGHGIAHQLGDLGVRAVKTLMPWDREKACGELVAGYADAVFGLAEPRGMGAPRPRLGVSIEAVEEGVAIRAVEKASIAEVTGLRTGDVILELAGRVARSAEDVRGVVLAMAPGTWLPLKVKRDGGTTELVAKFPAP